MKIDYLDKINDSNDSIVRFFDFDAIQAETFRKTIQQTIIENKKSLDVSTLDFITPINCNLVFRISNQDKGVTAKDPKTFYCDLTMDSYNKMTNLLEPFCKQNNSGYQWLYDINTPIDLLFSPSGHW
jgi:hypothetical protein